VILVFVILYFYIYFVFYSKKKKNLVERESKVVFIETLFEIVIYFKTKGFNILF
jgi:hypothetical protein